MKKLTFLLAVTLIITACSKDLFEQVVENPQFEYFNFETEEGYRAFLTSENPLSEFDHTYITLEEILKKSLEKIELCVTVEEIEKIVKESKGTLSIKKDNYGDLNVVETNSRFHPLFPFLNQHGIVKVENNFFKLLDDYLFISEIYGDLSKINSTDQPLENGVIKKHSIKLIPIGIQERWGDIIVLYDEVVPVDNPYCKNDRRIIFEQKLLQVNNYFNDPVLGPITEARNTLLAEVRASRKGIPCIWYSYNTAITWNNFYNEYDFVLNGNFDYGNIWDGNNIYVPNDNKIVRSQYLGSYLLGIDTFDFQWNIIQTDATHQGMGGVWLNYYYEL